MWEICLSILLEYLLKETINYTIPHLFYGYISIRVWYIVLCADYAVYVLESLMEGEEKNENI